MRSEGAAVGEMVTIQCRGCGVARDDSLGCGMAGYCYELLGCAVCQDFVLFEDYVFAPDEDRPTRACPQCSGPLHAVLADADRMPDGSPLWDDPTGASMPAIGTCPQCGGELVGGSIGLWD